MPSPNDKSILDGIAELKAVMESYCELLKLMLVELQGINKKK